MGSGSFEQQSFSGFLQWKEPGFNTGVTVVHRKVLQLRYFVGRVSTRVGVRFGVGREAGYGKRRLGTGMFACVCVRI